MSDFISAAHEIARVNGPLNIAYANDTFVQKIKKLRGKIELIEASEEFFSHDSSHHHHAHAHAPHERSAASSREKDYALMGVLQGNHRLSY
jgi:hypothetical protein